MDIIQRTALELLQELLQGNQSSTLIVSRHAIEAIIKQLEKEQHLVLDGLDDEFSRRRESS